MKTGEIFERMALRYDTEERRRNAAVIADAMRRELAGTHGKRALDYGCGTGLVGLALLDLFASMLFVDTSPQMVAQVELKLEAAGATTGSTLCADFTTQPPPDIKVDVILVSQVLLHVKDYALLLRRLYGLLDPGGQLLIVDFDKNERIVSDLVHNGFDQAGLTGLLKEIGFANVSTHTFFHGEKLFMNMDASQFILKATK